MKIKLRANHGYMEISGQLSGSVFEVEQGGGLIEISDKELRDVGIRLTPDGEAEPDFMWAFTADEYLEVTD